MSIAALSKRCRDAGDAYFMAMESLGHDVGIELRCTLRQSFERDQLLDAFEALLRRYPELRMQRQSDPEGGGWTWQPLAEEAAMAAWARQARTLRTGEGDPAAAQGLPLLLTGVHGRTLTFRSDHTFANGRAAFAWIARLLALLHGELPPAPASARGTAGTVLSLPRALGWFMRQSWVRRSFGAQRRDPGQPCRPANPPAQDAGWVSHEWTLPLPQLEAALQVHGLGRGASWTEAFSESLSQHLLASLPELPCVPVQWAVDLHEACGEAVPAQGNYTALVSAYLGRENSRTQQARLMQAVRQGLAPAQARLIQMQAPRRPAMIRWLRDRIWPRFDGGPREATMDPLLTLSNVGRLADPAFERWVEKASLWTRMPSIYVSCTTVGQTATLAMSFSPQLYDEARIQDCLERWIQSARQAGAAVACSVSSLAQAHPLTARHFELDLQGHVPLNWNGSPFRSQFLNSVSLILPAGERWIIDTVRRAIETLPEPQRSDWQRYGRDFIAQESIHSAVHRKYNEHMTAQGVKDWIAGKAEQRITAGEKSACLTQLASSVTYEYVTAMFCSRMIRDPSWLDGADPRMARFWLWHGCEELEHKHFVLDLFRAAGGSERQRIGWFILFSVSFLTDIHYQLYLTLRGSGLLWRWHTWRDAADFYFGRGGMAWVFAAGTLRFLAPGFRHADGPEDQLARQWFHSNPHTFVEGRRSHPAAAVRA